MYIHPESMRSMQNYKPQTPDEWAEQALMMANSAPTKAIAQLQVYRGVEFRAGRTEINLFIARNCEAALAYCRGRVMKESRACQSCKKGRGPFDKCVTLPGYLKGSCSNCHYNGEGNNCSFRLANTVNDVTPSVHTPTEDRGDNDDVEQQALHTTTTNTEARETYHTSNSIEQQPVMNANRKWTTQKAQKKAANRRRLALIYNSMADLFEEEAELLNEDIEF